MDKLIFGLNVIGHISENTEHSIRREKELSEAWKVASAILIPLSSVIVFNKNGRLTDYTDITEIFEVSSDIQNIYMKRVLSKYENNQSFFLIEYFYFFRYKKKFIKFKLLYD